MAKGLIRKIYCYPLNLLQVIKVGACKATDAAACSRICDITEDCSNFTIHHSLLQLMVYGETLKPGRLRLELLEKVALLRDCVSTLLDILEPNWPAIKS